MSIRVAYEVNKTKFLLWKMHAHPAVKASVCVLCFLAAISVLFVSLW